MFVKIMVEFDWIDLKTKLWDFYVTIDFDWVGKWYRSTQGRVYTSYYYDEFQKRSVTYINFN